MTGTKYDSSSIKCRECGAELETIEKGHLQSQNCTDEIGDVEQYRSKYPDAPTRTIEIRDKIADALKER